MAAAPVETEAASTAKLVGLVNAAVGIQGSQDAKETAEPTQLESATTEVGSTRYDNEPTVLGTSNRPVVNGALPPPPPLLTRGSERIPSLTTATLSARRLAVSLGLGHAAAARIQRVRADDVHANPEEQAGGDVS